MITAGQIAAVVESQALGPNWSVFQWAMGCTAGKNEDHKILRWTLGTRKKKSKRQENPGQGEKGFGGSAKG